MIGARIAHRTIVTTAQTHRLRSVLAKPQSQPVRSHFQTAATTLQVPPAGVTSAAAAPAAATAHQPAATQRRAIVTAAAANNKSSMSEEVATIGGGCFWCIEACYNQLRGVHSALSGYAGGHVENPTYEQVCGKQTGHAEVVQVKYDPSQIDYRTILQIFFSIHDPTTKDRQGNDVGPQYRSVIMYHSPEQKQIAEEVMKEITAEKWWTGSLVTELLPASTFYEAEKYHQRYYENNPSQGYCAFVVGPKVAKFRAKWSKLLLSSPSLA